jgi:hypothetical protein
MTGCASGVGEDMGERGSCHLKVLFHVLTLLKFCNPKTETLETSAALTPAKRVRMGF